MRHAKYLLVLALALAAAISQAMPVLAAPAVPANPNATRVMDTTRTLTEQQVAELTTLIAEEEAVSGNQIAVLMIPSLGSDSIEDYSLAVARGWGIGQKDKNNGVLLMIAKDDRKLRIEVGYGLEGALPDATAASIIRNQITPEFKNGNFFGGIKSGVKSIIAAIHNEYTVGPTDDSADSWQQWLFIILFIPLWLSAMLARSKSWWAGGAIGVLIGIGLGYFFGFLFFGILAILILLPLGLLFDWAISKNYRERKADGLSPSWWAGGGSSGRSGGGGFGGGSFGGGGSSGSW